MRESIDTLEFRKGQRLSAADMNALLRAAKRSWAGTPGSYDSETAAMLQRRSVVRDLVPFSNASGEEVPVGGIIRPGDQTLIAGIDGFEALKLDGAWRQKHLVCLFDPIPDGRKGWATWLGERDYCLYDGDSADPPAANETWGPKADEWFLVKGGYGFVCAGENADTLTLAKFSQHPAQLLWGTVTDDSVAEEATGSVLLKDAQFADTLGITMTSVLNKGVRVDLTNRDVSVAIVAGRPVMSSFKCPDPGYES